MSVETRTVAAAQSHRIDNVVALAAAIGAAALLTLAGAWFFELALDIRPCPLCLEQRYAYYLAIPLALLAAILALRRGPRALIILCFAVLALAMLGNAGLGVYHSGVEWRFWQGPTACSGSSVDLGSAGSLLQRLETVKLVRCDEVQWRFLGLSLAGYNVLISLALAGLAVAGLRAVRGRKA